MCQNVWLRCMKIDYHLFNCNIMSASLVAVFNKKINKKFLMINKHSG